jgi:hypothetical protein
MHGAAFFDGLRDGGRTQVPVPLGCGPLHQIRRVPGDDLVRDILTPEEIVDVRGVPCTTVPRATFDAMRYARTTREAVVALDMMAAAGLTTVAQMRDYVGRKQTWTGVQRARDAVALADDLSRSPQESRLRLIWQLDAGRGRPLVNRPVFDRQGRLLGYPDLLDPRPAWSASTTAPTTAPRGSTATTSTGSPASATTCSRWSGSPGRT